MKTYEVLVHFGTYIHNVVVYARHHVEAFEQALIVLAHAWGVPTTLPRPETIAQIDPMPVPER